MTNRIDHSTTNGNARASVADAPIGLSVGSPIETRPPKAYYKRPFDLALISAAFLTLLPLWLLLAIVIPVAIRLEDGGRVFYAQQRVGRGGRIFTMLKFRSMVEDAEQRTGPVLASPADHRTTKVGRAMRRLHLDEIPQVVNIIRGDMSVVGPRPERPELIAQIEQEIPNFRRRLRVRPGIAGLAQACADYHADPQQKLRYDNLYIDTMNPLLDIKLLLLCARRVLMPRRQVHGNARNAVDREPGADASPPEARANGASA